MFPKKNSHRGHRGHREEIKEGKQDRERAGRLESALALLSSLLCASIPFSL
jgi:hypothetical protein